jgi:hypothetical protein
MSYLHYMCLFAYSGVQHILRCVFVLCDFIYIEVVKVLLKSYAIIVHTEKKYIPLNASTATI